MHHRGLVHGNRNYLAWCYNDYRWLPSNVHQLQFHPLFADGTYVWLRKDHEGWLFGLKPVLNAYLECNITTSVMAGMDIYYYKVQTRSGIRQIFLLYGIKDTITTNNSRKSKRTPHNLINTLISSYHIMTPFDGLQKHHFSTAFSTSFEALHGPEILDLLIGNKPIVNRPSFLLSFIKCLPLILSPGGGGGGGGGYGWEVRFECAGEEGSGVGGRDVPVVLGVDDERGGFDGLIGS